MTKFESHYIFLTKNIIIKYRLLSLHLHSNAVLFISYLLMCSTCHLLHMKKFGRLFQRIFGEKVNNRCVKFLRKHACLVHISFKHRVVLEMASVARSCPEIGRAHV